MIQITIHNITGEASRIVDDICQILNLKTSVTISFINDELYHYEIFLEDRGSIVPFMIRFFHRIDNVDYEKIEIM